MKKVLMKIATNGKKLAIVDLKRIKDKGPVQEIESIEDK